MSMLKNDYVKEYIRVKNQLPLVQCFKLVQNITLMVGGILYIIHPISVLLALVFYFWFELALKHINLVDTQQKLIRQSIEDDALMYTCYTNLKYHDQNILHNIQ